MSDNHEGPVCEAIQAALAYDAAIQGCANNPSEMASFCTAEGDDLDDLYADWISKSRAAASLITLKGLFGTPAPQCAPRELHGWQVEEGVTCVVCPECAFTMDATHVDSTLSGYTCPLCVLESWQEAR